LIGFAVVATSPSKIVTGGSRSFHGTTEGLPPDDRQQPTISLGASGRVTE
jgi:hypothetical protein